MAECLPSINLESMPAMAGQSETVMTNSQGVMGTQEAASTLGVSVRTIQLWVEKGLLKAWKTQGGHRRITRHSVLGLMDARARGENPKASPDELNILVVEDDLTMQAYYKALLEIQCPGANVMMASNGYEGLICLGRSLPDLMLLDVDMPEMDGIKMLRNLRRQEILQDLSIAVVSGLSATEVAERGGIPANIPLYTKPLGLESLNQILKTLEDGRKAAAP
jgi:excisionase family DNA binding protein